MPFPRVKGQIYEDGFHLPLAIRWPPHVRPGRVVDDFVDVRDFAPTFLAASGLTPPPEMSGNSFLDVLSSERSGQVVPSRNVVLVGKERHDLGRPHDWGYPVARSALRSSCSSIITSPTAGPPATPKPGCRIATRGRPKRCWSKPAAAFTSWLSASVPSSNCIGWPTTRSVCRTWPTIRNMPATFASCARRWNAVAGRSRSQNLGQRGGLRHLQVPGRPRRRLRRNPANAGSESDVEIRTLNPARTHPPGSFRLLSAPVPSREANSPVFTCLAKKAGARAA